jgi:hypothetical protein
MINTKLLLKQDKAEEKQEAKTEGKIIFSTYYISMPLFFF